MDLEERTREVAAQIRASLADLQTQNLEDRDWTSALVVLLSGARTLLRACPPQTTVRAEVEQLINEIGDRMFEDHPHA